jgi:ADP-ribose pyrophosphatase
MKPWKTLSSQHVLQDNFLSLRTDRCQRDDGHIVPTYHVLEFSEWVTVIPFTSAGNLVLVREYRHAAGKVMIGFPGGVADPGETDWAKVGARELVEETGFVARELIPVGACYPNPAIQNNRVHFFIGLGCKASGAQELDSNEDIEILQMPYTEFLRYEALDVQHAIHAAALFYTDRYFKKTPGKRPRNRRRAV